MEGWGQGAPLGARGLPCVARALLGKAVKNAILTAGERTQGPDKS